MSYVDNIQATYKKARQMAAVADQVNSVNMVIRGPVDRRRDGGVPEQTTLIPVDNTVDCDIKLDSSIVVSGLDQEIAEAVRRDLQEALATIAEHWNVRASMEMQGCHYCGSKGASGGSENN